MKPINLYTLTRITDYRRFLIQEKLAASRGCLSRLRTHEVESVRSLVDCLSACDIGIKELEGFFLSYEIPQIGKEFDLLKVGENEILNIELKSVDIGQNKIKEQLVRNRYFLGHLQKKLLLFTYVSSTKSWYTLDGDRFGQSDAAAVAVHLKKESFDRCYTGDLDELFRVCDYLVSPITTPERFIDGNYFLTQQQQDIKRKLVRALFSQSHASYISIIGASGTGKTLLVYDLAKTLAQSVRKKRSVAIVHCGVILEAHRLLQSRIANLDIIPESALNKSSLDKYDFLLIDEAHRLSKKRMSDIICRVDRDKCVFIFSFDESRYFSNARQLRNMTVYIRSLYGIREFRLSGKIRANREMSMLVNALSGTDTKKHEPFKTISLLYAASKEEAEIIIGYKRSQSFLFIGYADRAFDYGSDIDASRIMGQEFDRVIMVVDSSFYLTDRRTLTDRAPATSSGTRTDQLYQGIMRTSEELCLVVVSNEELFGKLQTVM